LTGWRNRLAQYVPEPRPNGGRDLYGRTLRSYGCDRRRDLDAVAYWVHVYLIAVICDVGNCNGLPVESVSTLPLLSASETWGAPLTTET
jgi:hypothetical protein